MTTKTWTGPSGGDNLATNPPNWTPSGAPASGDVLNMGSVGGEIGVVGNVLQGDVLNLGATGSNVVDLSGNADVAIEAPAYADTRLAVNVDGAVILSFGNEYPGSLAATITLAPGASLDATENLTFGTLTITGGAGSSITNNGTSHLSADSGTDVIGTDVNGSGTFVVSSAQSHVTQPKRPTPRVRRRLRLLRHPHHPRQPRLWQT